MQYEQILYSVEDKVATITMNRPDKLNAWTGQMEKEFRHALAAAETSDDVRVIILTGAGKGFCAGADLGGLSSTAESGGIDSERREAWRKLDQPGMTYTGRDDFRLQFTYMPSVAKPIIAAINGACAGLGFVHAMFCDLRFSSDRAKFTTAFAQRGLIAEHGLSWMLTRQIGLQNAMDLTLSGRVILADEAERMGFCRVVPHDMLMDAVKAYAADLAAKSSPRSMGIIKREIYDALLQDLGEAVDRANHDMHDSLKSEDFKEGVRSFVEKRPPQWTGK